MRRVGLPAVGPALCANPNTQLGGYYNVVKPDDAANWQLRVQVQFMFPK